MHSTGTALILVKEESINNTSYLLKFEWWLYFLDGETCTVYHWTLRPLRGVVSPLYVFLRIKMDRHPLGYISLKRDIVK